MALAKRHDQVEVGATIADITAATSSLKTLSESNSNFVLNGIDAVTGNVYSANNGDVRQVSNSLTLYHDFATDGGAIGTINLRGGSLPDNAIIDNAWFEVITGYASATDAATIALGIATDDATGIQAAVAISATGDIWDAGIDASDIDPSTSTTFTTKTTASRALIMTLAVEAVTAGKLVLHVDYRVSEGQ